MKELLFAVPLVLMVFVLAVSCDDGGNDKPAMGSKLGDCYPDGTCDGILTCISGVCVDLNESSDTDTNTPDNTTDNTQLDTDTMNSDNINNDTSPDNDIPSHITKQWGTALPDGGQSIAVDSSGNIFVTGYTAGSFEGYTNPNPDPSYVSDIFLTKWSADYTKAWTKQWGTIEAEGGISIAVDSSGNIFVTGRTDGSFEGYTNVSGPCGVDPCSDIYLTKLNSDGTQAWTKQWGTTSADSGQSVAVDSSGNIFITGHTSGSLDGNNTLCEANCDDPFIAGDIFLTKWNADGTKAWTKQWGTAGQDIGNSVAIDSSGSIFVTGYTRGSLDGNVNADPNGSMADIFLTKWNTDGTKAWTKQWGTTGQDEYGQYVAVDSNGNIFVAGFTNGSLDGNTNAGANDIFLTKWSADGTKAWTKQWGTAGEDVGYSVALDNNGNIFVTGGTDNSFEGYTNEGVTDIFLTRWNTDGTETWTKQWGTSVWESSFSAAVDNKNVFVIGSTNGSLDGNVNVGNADIFLSIFSLE